MVSTVKRWDGGEELESAELSASADHWWSQLIDLCDDGQGNGIAGLDRRYATALLLHTQHGMTVRQIGGILGIHFGHVSRMIRQTQALLQRVNAGEVPVRQSSDDVVEELNFLRIHALSDEQWETIRPLIPGHRSGRGRAWGIDFRTLIPVLLWYHRTGLPWHRCPTRPPITTCKRWLYRLRKDGTLDRIIAALA